MTEKKRKNKKKNTYKKYLPIYNFLRFPVKLFLKIFIGFVPQKKKYDVKGPFVVLSNHVTDFDMLMVALNYKEHMFFVGSEHIFRMKIGKLVEKIFSPIACSKGKVSASTVLEMMRRVRKGYNICIFPEGGRSNNGLTGTLDINIAALVKKLGCSLVTNKIEGGYFTTPRWGKGIRKGKVVSKLVRVYSSEEIKNMTDDELLDRIQSDLNSDAYEENSKLSIAYKGKTLAENIEYALVLCPKCKKFGTLKSSGSHFSCDCGLCGKYDEYGKISGAGFDFETVTQWDLWQKGEIERLPEPSEDERLLCEGGEQILREVNDIDHTYTEIAKGKLKITDKAFFCGDMRFDFSDINECDINLFGILVFSTRDGRYFEVRSDVRYPGYMYKLLFDRYKNIRKEI